MALRWRRGKLVITTALNYSTKPELTIYAGPNPANGVLEIHDGEDLWQWSRVEISLNAFLRSTILQQYNNHTTIHHHYHHHHQPLQSLCISPTFCLRTEMSLSCLNISKDYIFAIIKNLNSNKSHWWDDLSIKMIELCVKFIVFPVKLISEAYWLGGEFSECWKRGNVVSVHKKESQNLVKNYRSISLLPIFGNIFERVIFKDLLNY